MAIGLLWTVLGLLVLLAVYLAAANLALNRPYLQTWIRRRLPKRLSVRWKHGRSAYPGHFQLLDLHLTATSDGGHWRCEAASATGRVSVRSLLAGVLDVNRLVVHDAVCRFRWMPAENRNRFGRESDAMPAGGAEAEVAGQFHGRLRLAEKVLKTGSHVSASVDRCAGVLFSHRLRGAGRVRLHVAPEDPESMQVSIDAYRLRVSFDGTGSIELLHSKAVSMTARMRTSPSLRRRRKPFLRDLAIRVPDAALPDIHAYQRYLPRRWPLKLHHGQGKIDLTITLARARLHTQLKVVCKAADVSVGAYRFSSRLEIEICAGTTSPGSGGLDLAGSRIQIEQAVSSPQEQGRTPPWKASLVVDRGHVGLKWPDDREAALGARLFGALESRKLLTGLNTGKDRLKLSGRVSDLQWLPRVFGNPHRLAVHGAGKIIAEVRIDAGWVGTGTRIEIAPEAPTVDVLDYVAAGNGRITLTVDRGGERPDLSLTIVLSEALLMRQGEDRAEIENATIIVHAVGKRMTVDGSDSDVRLNLQIPGATVRDMSVYNRYFPAGTSARLLGGSADLTADVILSPESAGGFVKLFTRGLAMRVDDQEISGALSVDVQLSDGVPRKMEFDISGSSLTLDQVSVIGKQGQFQQAAWQTHLEIRKGHARWSKPTHVGFEAEVAMTDTRPLAAVMSNQRGRHGWLERIFSVGNVKGMVHVTVAHDQVVIPYALAESDDIDVGAKGVFGQRYREGVFYVRYKKLKGILMVKDARHQFHLFNAKKKFDRYSPNPVTGLKAPLHG